MGDGRVVGGRGSDGRWEGEGVMGGGRVVEGSDGRR